MEAIRQVTSPINLLPAYDVHRYQSAEAALEAWKAGKDFKIVGGNYCSIRDKGVLKANSSGVYILWNRVDAVRVV